MTSQNDKVQLEKAKEMTYLKGFYEGVSKCGCVYVCVCACTGVCVGLFCIACKAAHFF